METDVETAEKDGRKEDDIIEVNSDPPEVDWEEVLQNYRQNRKQKEREATAAGRRIKRRNWYCCESESTVRRGGTKFFCSHERCGTCQDLIEDVWFKGLDEQEISAVKKKIHECLLRLEKEDVENEEVGDSEKEARRKELADLRELINQEGGFNDGDSDERNSLMNLEVRMLPYQNDDSFKVRLSFLSAFSWSWAAYIPTPPERGSRYEIYSIMEVGTHLNRQT